MLADLAGRLIQMATALIVLGSPARAAARGEEAMAQLLPEKIAGWSRADEDKVFTRRNIFEYMDGAGEIYLAYDFQRLLVREYAKSSAPRIVAEIYQVSSSEDAYGVFSHDREGKAIPLGQAAIYGGGLLRFWKGRIFVRLMAESETPATRAAVMALGRRIEAAIPRAGEKPRLLACLPSEGLLRDSLHYFHTQVSLNAHYFLADANLLDLSPKAEALLARYRRGSGKMRLLLCRYPAWAAAKAAFEHFNRVYFSDKPAPKSTTRVEKVEKGQFVGAQWNDRFVILVFEASDRKTCAALSTAVLGKIKEVFP